MPRSKLHQPTKTPLVKLPEPLTLSYRTLADLAGPLLQSPGYVEILNSIDDFALWPQVITIISLTSEETAKFSFAGWISIMCGLHIAIYSSGAFSSFIQTMGCKQIGTPVYYPPANGLADTFRGKPNAALQVGTNGLWSDT